MDQTELETWKALNELPEVKAVFECWLIGDYYLHNDEVYQCFAQGYMCCEPIWIPPLHDPIRPERSLIGIYWENRFPVSWADIMCADRPDLALARAILAEPEKG